MLLDKKRVGLITKVGAVFIALVFILSYIPMVYDFVDSGASQDPSSGQQTQAQVAARIAELEQAVQKNPKDLGSLIQLGNAYHDQRIYDKAIATYSKVLELDPKNVNARVDMAIDYFYSNQVETATVEARKGVEIDPKHANAHFNLGIFLSAQGKNDEAIKEFKEYLKLEPGGQGAEEAKRQIKVLQDAMKSPTTTVKGK